jgi:hypothetical protein
MKTKLLLLTLAVLLASPAFGQYENRNRGMTLGAIMGGLGGAAIGEHNNKLLAGAAIGTAVGALAGAAVGDSVDANVAREQAYRQQMYHQHVRSQGVTVNGVISMVQSRLSDDVIITHIHSNGLAYRPQPNDLIMLSQSGVSDRVIRAMQTAPLASAAPPPAPVYRDRVVVEEHYYVRPYPYPRHYYHPPPYYYHPRPHPGPRTHIHYGVTIGR